VSRKFESRGKLYEGGHINYLGVGMLAAHYDLYQSIPSLVVGHNVGQAIDQKNMRHFKDIFPGDKWAIIGADYYRWRSRKPRR
jgi:hypothetical protein